MITVSICEDEAYFVSELRKLLDEYCRFKGIGLSTLTFSNGEQLLASGQTSDIILMDIKLPGRDGMDIVQKLRDCGNDNPVIFITAYPQYVFQAFDLDAVHYILKPVSAEKLFPAIDKAVKRVSSDCGKTLLITSGTRASRVPLRDILYCEAMDHQITIHTPAETFQFFGTLDAVQERVDDRFFRSHKSYLVNMDHIVEKQTDFAIVDGGDRVLIARRKQREFTQRLLDTCRKGLI